MYLYNHRTNIHISRITTLAVVLFLLAPAIVFAQDIGIAADYPHDINIATDPDVIFASGFEGGFRGWTKYNNKISVIVRNKEIVNSGSACLQTTATRGKDTGADVVFTFPKPVDQVYLRFYTKFHKDTIMPHHFVKIRAKNINWRGYGRGAGYRPDGDKAFWTGIEPSKNKTWHFYTYWYKMHSFENPDGTTNTPPDGNGTSFYGNSFNPTGQTPFNRDEWICVEAMMKANTVGKNDGEKAFWINGKKIGHWRTGEPMGSWIRDKFTTADNVFNKNPKPFEGFDFRSSDAVKIYRIDLQWYVSQKVAEKSETDKNIVYFDDVVVATEYIGPRVETK